MSDNTSIPSTNPSLFSITTGHRFQKSTSADKTSCDLLCSTRLSLILNYCCSAIVTTSLEMRFFFLRFSSHPFSSPYHDDVLEISNFFHPSFSNNSSSRAGIQETEGARTIVDGLDCRALPFPSRITLSGADLILDGHAFRLTPYKLDCPSATRKFLSALVNSNNYTTPCYFHTFYEQTFGLDGKDCILTREPRKSWTVASISRTKWRWWWVPEGFSIRRIVADAVLHTGICISYCNRANEVGFGQRD